MTIDVRFEVFFKNEKKIHFVPIQVKIDYVRQKMKIVLHGFVIPGRIVCLTDRYMNTVFIDNNLYVSSFDKIL